MSAAEQLRVRTPDSVSARMTATAAAMENLLAQILDGQPMPLEWKRPPRLLAAMRHAALGGGKRFRPFLIAETAALFDVPPSRALTAGAALECVHCYSLIHDDLPAMDNDDLRRGKPTVHKAFDTATAVLAGDALLTLAFDIMARPETHPDGAIRSELVLHLARAAGLGGMAGGQMLDLSAEGRFGQTDRPHTLEDIATLQAMKTGALIRFACEAGGILGNAAEPERVALKRYGTAIGEAFQIADDLLDIDGDSVTLGKAAHKDEAVAKATFPMLLGHDGAQKRLSVLVDGAIEALHIFGGRGDILAAAAHFVAERRS